jgi:hypothetical protein
MTRRLRGVAASLLVLGAFQTAAAVRLPDWAKALADAAPPVPEGVPKHPVRILYRGVALELLPAGEGMRVRERVAVQVLSGRAGDARFRSFPFDDTAKIKVARGWSLPPGSGATKASSDPLEITLSDHFLTDDKSRFIVTDDVGKGALVFYEFEAEQFPHTLTWRDRIYEGAPIDRAVIEAHLPPGWSVRSAWLGGGGPPPESAGAVRRWTLTGVEPGPDEPLAGEPWETAPLLVLAFQPPRPEDSKRPTFASWDDVAAWYTRLAAGRTELPEATRAEAMAAIEAAGTDRTARLHAAIRFVRDRIRYVAREVGIGGFQPHAAAQTYRDRAGDCKDKATLLQAVVGLAGYTAYPLLINVADPGLVAEDVPGPAFDHMVLGVALPAEAELPGDSAIVETDGLGRLLVVDTTDEFASPGTLPVYLAGKTGLVVAGLRGHLVRLPAARPEDHAVATELEAEVRPDRSVSARMTIVRRGEPAEIARQAAREGSREWEAGVKKALRATLPEASPGRYTVALETDDGAFAETLAFDVPPPLAGRQPDPVPFFPRALADLTKTQLTRRVGAVVYDYPLTLAYTTTVKGVAAGNTLPAGQNASGDGWSVASEWMRDGAATKGTLRFVLSRTRFAPESFTELKQMWSSATKAASAHIPIP